MCPSQDVHIRRSFLRAAGPLPGSPIGPPTHRPTVQAALTTGVASYHSAVVKVHRAGIPRRPSGRTLPHPPIPRQDRRKTDAKSSPSHRPVGVALCSCLVSPTPPELNFVARSLYLFERACQLQPHPVLGSFHFQVGAPNRRLRASSGWAA